MPYTCHMPYINSYCTIVHGHCGLRRNLHHDWAFSKFGVEASGGSGGCRMKAIKFLGAIEWFRAAGKVWMLQSEIWSEASFWGGASTSNFLQVGTHFSQMPEVQLRFSWDRCSGETPSANLVKYPQSIWRNTLSWSGEMLNIFINTAVGCQLITRSPEQKYWNQTVRNIFSHSGQIQLLIF